MKLLLDHCVPHTFARLLPDHEVEYAINRGWQDLSNGELLRLAKEHGFQAMITIDQNLRYQQHLRTLPLSVVVMESRDSRIQGLRPLVPFVLQGLALIERESEQAIVVVVGLNGIVSPT